MTGDDQRLVDTFRESVELLASWSASTITSSIIRDLPDHLIAAALTE